MPGSPGAFVLQMLLVFTVRPDLWNLSTFCKVSWFCQCVVKKGPCAFHPLGYKTHRFQNPPTCPKGLTQSFRESVQMCPGEYDERKTGLCPVEMEGGDKKKGWKCLGERTFACSPEMTQLSRIIRLSQPWHPAWRLSVSVLVTGGGTVTMAKEKPWRHSCDQIKVFFA